MSFQEAEPLVDPDDSSSEPDMTPPVVDPDRPLDPPEEPEHVDPEPLQVVEPRPDALQIADPVGVGVREAARVDLVHHCGLPPLRFLLKHCAVSVALHCSASVALLHADEL